MTDLKKDDVVFYDAYGITVRARVLRVHRDGMVTIKSLFNVNDDGTDMMGYLGYTYRRVNPTPFYKTPQSVADSRFPRVGGWVR